MASYQNPNRKLNSSIQKQDPKQGPTNEQKVAHVESLLRRLYAKVDELENICKEEKEFYDILKRRGKKGIPKFDSQLLPKTVAHQQRCAEAAFNNLDVFKRNSRPANTRKVTIDAPIKERERIRDGEIRSASVTDGAAGHWHHQRGHSMRDKSSVRGSSSVLLQQEDHPHPKEHSWYGSLDRNMKKKKRQFLDRNRRHTKTVGSLAGLNVENIEMLQPDEQYAYGLPTLNNVPEANFLLNMPVHQPYNPHRVDNNSNTANMRLPHQDFSLQWQLPPHHSYSRSQPVPVFHSKVSEMHNIRWLESNVDTVSPPELPPNNVTQQYEGAGITDVNFNRLNISSPTEASERSSRSSENGDTKGSFLNESCKPFEMSDYYKYSTKFRTQTKSTSGIPTPSPSEATAIQRMNGLIGMRSESVPYVGKHMYSDSLDTIDGGEPSTVPKLPPKLRPVLNDSGSMQMSASLSSLDETRPDLRNHNARDREPWVHVNPTIV